VLKKLQRNSLVKRLAWLFLYILLLVINHEAERLGFLEIYFFILSTLLVYSHGKNPKKGYGSMLIALIYSLFLAPRLHPLFNNIPSALLMIFIGVVLSLCLNKWETNEGND